MQLCGNIAEKDLVKKDKSKKKLDPAYLVMFQFENSTVKHAWEFKGAVSLHLHRQNSLVLCRFRIDIN